jgi:hypothetical protein
MRFTFFALRDRLAILAMQGHLKEDSSEYETLIILLNKSINITRHFEIVEFLKSMYAVYCDQTLQKRIDAILEHMDHQNEEYQSILYEYFTTIHSVLTGQTKLLRKTLPGLIYVVNIFDFLSSLKRILRQKQEVLNVLDQDIENKMHRIGATA